MVYSNFKNAGGQNNTRYMDSYRILNSPDRQMYPSKQEYSTPVQPREAPTPRTSPQPMGNTFTGESVMRDTALVPLVPPTSQMQTPTTVESPYYTAGFLRNYIGHNMRVEFLVGSSGPLVDRIGRLVEVGASYIVLQPIEEGSLVMCDLYSIKFVTIYN